MIFLVFWSCLELPRSRQRMLICCSVKCLRLQGTMVISYLLGWNELTCYQDHAIGCLEFKQLNICSCWSGLILSSALNVIEGIDLCFGASRASAKARVCATIFDSKYRRMQFSRWFPLLQLGLVSAAH